MRQLKELTDPNVVVMLVGNMCDLEGHSHRSVTYMEAILYAGIYVHVAAYKEIKNGLLTLVICAMVLHLSFHVSICVCISLLSH